MYLPCDSYSPGGSMYFRKMEEEHNDFTERLRKSLYFGQLPGTDRPSLPLTDLAVRYYQDAAPKELGKLDHYWAASTARAACMTPSSMVAGMMYVNRLKKRKAEYLQKISSSELFLISVMMASKFLYDEGVDEEVFNDEWATSGNLDIEDVNELEREFLSAIDWQLFVQPEDFKKVLNNIEKRIALEQGIDRGWFSYTDLDLLTGDVSLFNLCDSQVRELMQVFGVSTLAYIAGILTMISSTILATTASSTLVHFGTASLPQLARLLPVTYPITLEGPNMDHAIISTDYGNLVDQHQHGVYCNKTVEQDVITNNNGAWDIKNETMVTDTELKTTATEGTSEQTSNDDHLDDTKIQRRDNRQFIGGFLSPLLALVTLKDTIMKFSQTLLEQEQTHFDDQLDVEEAQEICSDGPCLLDSWANCWNVSSGHDWSSFKAQESRKSNGLNYGHKDLQYYSEQMGKRVPGTVCCCTGTGHGLVKRLGLHYRYMDSFNIGFTTASAFPVYVTT